MWQAILGGLKNMYLDPDKRRNLGMKGKVVMAAWLEKMVSKDWKETALR